MKRFFALILVLSLLLAACGGSTEPTTAPEATHPAEQPSQTQPAATEQPAQVPAETVGYTQESWTLVDDDKLVFTVTGFVDNEHLGLQMHVYCENKTDRNMIFSLDGVSVCGVMYDPFWAQEVAGGKKINDVISFDTFDLAQMGVDAVDEISFRLSVIDSDNWMDQPFADEWFTIYPTGLDADTVVYPQYRHKNGETVILDNDRLLFIVEKVEDSGSDTYTLNCYIANRTDKDLLIGWDQVSVNGFMVDPFWADAVGAGKQLYTQISFNASDLAEQGIETVTEIEFTITASDYESFDTILEENCTFQPK